MSKTIDDLVQKVQILNDNLKINQAHLSNLPIDFGTLDDMMMQCARLQELGAKADDLRAQLKSVTLQSNEIMDGVKLHFQEIKKVVKSNFTQENWIKYGVQDKR